MSSASINDYWNWEELAFNVKTRLWDMDSLINERKNENIVESICWFDHLSKEIESAECIEITLNLNVNDEGGCDDYPCTNNNKNEELTRYLDIKYQDEFLNDFKKEKSYTDFELDCCIVTVKTYTIKNYKIISS